MDLVYQRFDRRRCRPDAPYPSFFQPGEYRLKLGGDDWDRDISGWSHCYDRP